MKKILFNLVLVFSLGAMTQCGGGSSGTSSDDDGDDGATEVSDTVVATTGTVSAVTDSVSSLVSSFGGSGGGALIKGGSTDEGKGEVTCTDDFSECTFGCPGGGSVTETFNDDFSDSECDMGDGTTGFATDYETTGTMTFNDCVMEECGTTITISGTNSFSGSGSFNGCTGEWDFSGTFSSGEGDNICGSDLTASPADGAAIAVVFEMTYAASGNFADFTEDVSGSFGAAEETATECTVNTFASWQELEELFDSQHSCDAAEEAHHIDECIENCTTGCTDSGEDADVCAVACKSDCSTDVSCEEGHMNDCVDAGGSEADCEAEAAELCSIDPEDCQTDCVDFCMAEGHPAKDCDAGCTDVCSGKFDEEGEGSGELNEECFDECSSSCESHGESAEKCDSICLDSCTM